MDCIFCQIVAGERPARILFQDAAVTALHDVNPVAPTHILVIPNRHLTSLDELGPGEEDLAARLLVACRQAAREAGIGDSGYRVVTNIGREGGQHIRHLHFHVLGGRRLTWPPG